ncbi:MAG: ABC transporter substrate-binding protein [Gemmatimonadota bacterium]
MSRWTRAAVASVWALLGCVGGGESADTAVAEPDADSCAPAPSADQRAQYSELRHAVGFSLSYEDGHTVITTHPPVDQGGGEDVVVLVSCGHAAPPLSGRLAGAHVIERPIRTVAANEDLSLTRMRVLGLRDRVIGVGSRGIFDDGLRALFDSGAAAEIGASFHGPPRFETLLSIDPDVTFLSTASLTDATSLDRTRELGLAAVPAVSWVEPTLLGQGEWLHYVAALMGAEDIARPHFDEVEARYLELATRAARADRAPLVLWIDPSGAGDRWVVPSNSWKARAIQDAGGRVAFARSDGPTTVEATSEEILELGDSIFAVVTESIALNEPGSTGALEGLPAVVEGRLFSVHRRALPEYDAYDWYESAVVEVDKVLEDFVALLHPDLVPGHIPHHLIPARTGSEPARAPRP